MIVDYHKLYRTREELADFILLPMIEQKSFLAQWAAKGREGLSMQCSIERKISSIVNEGYGTTPDADAEEDSG